MPPKKSDLPKCKIWHNPTIAEYAEPGPGDIDWDNKTTIMIFYKNSKDYYKYEDSEDDDYGKNDNEPHLYSCAAATNKWDIYSKNNPITIPAMVIQKIFFNLYLIVISHI
jgi:hypothetical protein